MGCSRLGDKRGRWGRRVSALEPREPCDDRQRRGGEKTEGETQVGVLALVHRPDGCHCDIGRDAGRRYGFGHLCVALFEVLLLLLFIEFVEVWSCFFQSFVFVPGVVEIFVAVYLGGVLLFLILEIVVLHPRVVKVIFFDVSFVSHAEIAIYVLFFLFIKRVDTDVAVSPGVRVGVGEGGRG